MEVCQGAAVFPGIAAGKILYYHKNEYEIRQYAITNIKTEIALFHEACSNVCTTLDRLYEEQTAAGSDSAAIFLEQKKLLQSGSYRRAIESVIQTETVNAAYAVMTTRDEMTAVFQDLESPIIRERLLNIREISDRLICVLGGVSPRIDLGEEPVILVTESITPAELLEMDRDKLLAIVTHHGSEISHAAIMAKTMDIPTLINVDTKEEWDGEWGIVDGYTRTFYIRPEEDLRKEYELRRLEDQEEREELLKLRTKPDLTADGKRVGIYANIGNLDDINSAQYYGAAGIGLLRSEFQYLGRESYPGENELFQAYKKLAESTNGQVAVIRTADFGADKKAEYMQIPDEANPIMGNRGIRLSLNRKELFATQLRAIYRASAYGNLAVMYPMMTSEEEILQVEEIIREVKEGLDLARIPYQDIRTGIMIETPAAVMISRTLAKHVDFLGIGTNDLTQYVLAMDRQNPALRDIYNNHHPAVLEMIRMTIENGHKENCIVYICGELAADTELTQTFVEMGVDALSVVPACILPLRRTLGRIHS